MESFQISAESLSNLMKDRDIDGTAKLSEKYGGLQGLLKSLQTSSDRGISTKV